MKFAIKFILFVEGVTLFLWGAICGLGFIVNGYVPPLSDLFTVIAAMLVLSLFSMYVLAPIAKALFDDN